MVRHLALVRKQVQDPGEGELWLFWCGKRATRMVDLLVLATNHTKILTILITNMGEWVFGLKIQGDK